ncbi:hypothetical protein, partial [Nostoc sp. T09]|uniref:hypothetical protein n=1 Tax=Nostoc sp. T09 TaxID=1932621 RepID=UPI00117D1EF8
MKQSPNPRDCYPKGFPSGSPVHASRYPAGSRFRRLQVWRPNALAPLCRRHFLQVGEPAQRSAS